MLWRARQFGLDFESSAQLMGIVNVTPDSFSDGGQFIDRDRAVEHALRLIDEGADLIDIGGESTRPGATPVSEGDELKRVIPVIAALVPRIAVPISIDTMKPAVAAAAIEAGASIVNDVAAHRADLAMARLIARTGAGYVLMHMQGTPATMQVQPSYTDVVAEVNVFFGDRLARLRAAGVAAEQVALDVGIGFGKTVEHNLELLAHLKAFTPWQRPVLLGVSRKSFLGVVTGAKAVSDRLSGSLACACWAGLQGVRIIRTHDIAATRQALRMIEAIDAKTHSGAAPPP